MGDSGLNKDSLIEQVWDVEQEIMDVIDAFCKEHKIPYSLFYGTLLGAVRHKGFIPWDDDIDIIMTRKNYEKFKKLWLAQPVDGYIFQDLSTDEDYTNNFIKIRKDHTAFVQTEGEREKHYHKGIFVDIFPVDHRAVSKVGRMIQYVAAAVELLYTRRFTSGNGGIIGLTERILLAMPSALHPVLRSWAHRILIFWNRKAGTPYFCACTIDSCKVQFPAELFHELTRMEFRGRKYLTVKQADTALKLVYGDYMQLPPEEERVWHHHPIVIDFEHNYEEMN